MRLAAALPILACAALAACATPHSRIAAARCDAQAKAAYVQARSAEQSRLAAAHAGQAIRRDCGASGTLLRTSESVTFNGVRQCEPALATAPAGAKYDAMLSTGDRLQVESVARAARRDALAQCIS